jgi:IS30 family transposase
VARKLALQWSPQQIAGWLRETFPGDPELHVSHETIYRSLFIQSRGVLRRTLLGDLRRQRRFRHARASARVRPKQGQILDAVSIRERPADVEDRALPGSELAAHRAFTIATDVQVYFCDPQSPWQRGSNENTNGLLRQYLRHAADLSRYTQAQLDAIALRLNTRPRMTLAYRTPAVKLADIVASMG